MMIEVHTTLTDAVRLPFRRMAALALPAEYELSLVICGDGLARRMNTAYRRRTYSPNVLSFPLSRREGEIFLNIRKAEREARSMGISARKRAALLFVHGCAHLAGHDHSDAMERLEQKVLRKFSLA